MAVISLGSNVASLNTQRRLSESTQKLSKSFTRLASGLRINTASDDASGLAIASSLNADARVLNQGIRNINDGIGMLNIAEGSLSQLSNITIRQRELATQSANGVLTLAQRKALNSEANSLTDEFNRIVATTEFNGRKLLDPSLETQRVQAGYGSSGGINFGLGDKLKRNIGTGEFEQLTYIGAGGTEGEFLDFNGDGVVDVAIAGSIGTEVSVALGSSSGTLNPIVTYSTGLGATASAFAAGDVNNDGIFDFVASAGTNFSVMIGNADGSFRAGVTFSNGGTGGSLTSIVIGDFDSDGKADIAGVGSLSVMGTTIYRGNGNGTFAFGQIISDTAIPDNIKTGDLNGDGIQDLIYQSTSNVSFLIGNGNGTFKRPASFSFVSTTYGVDIADFNGDGLSDILIAQSDPLILLSNGNGTFKVSAIQNSLGIYSVAGDFNGDGYTDISTNSSTQLQTFFGNGDGTFRAQISYTAASTFGSNTTAVDLNSDGVMDLAGPAYYQLSKTTTTTTTAHLNINTQSGARAAMSVLDKTLQRINQELGAIGSTQSRFSSAVSNLFTTTENYTTARSRITDADIAEESAGLVKNQILQSAGASLLAQANQAPALALKLLQ